MIMDLTKEVFSKIGRLTRLTKCRPGNIIVSRVNNIWSDFIFRDIKLAKRLQQKGYEFTLIGQDIYDKVNDSGLPTQHYSYLLVVTYMDRIINPCTHTTQLRDALYKELIGDYISLDNDSIIYSSVNKDNSSAGVFIYVTEGEYHLSTINLCSVLGDSLLYLNVNLPYLRFCCTKSIRVCNIHSDVPLTVAPSNILNIVFDTHMNGYTSEKIGCYLHI